VAGDNSFYYNGRLSIEGGMYTLATPRWVDEGDSNGVGGSATAFATAIAAV